jgi:TPR repeat protein
MKLLKVFIFCICVISVSTPLVFAICNNNNVGKTEAFNTGSSDVLETEGNLAETMAERDRLLHNRDYQKAFSYLRTLCEKYKDSESCNLTYSTYFAMQDDSVNVSPSAQNITLYEVLYYLDLGCKLNNYDSCMKAARLYEYGSKPGASQMKGYNIDYDAQEAKKYYKRVCESVSDSAMDACSRVVELSRQSNRNVPLADSFVDNLVKKLN